MSESLLILVKQLFRLAAEKDAASLSENVGRNVNVCISERESSVQMLRLMCNEM